MTVYYHPDSESFLEGVTPESLKELADSGHDIFPMEEKDLVAMVTRLQTESGAFKEAQRQRYREIMELAERGVNGDSKHAKNFSLSRIHGIAKGGNDSIT